MGAIIAGLLSLIIPGLGQFYNGELLKALGVFVLWIVVGWVAFGTGILFFLPLIVWLYAIFEAYSTRKKKE